MGADRRRVVFLSGSRYSRLGGEIAQRLAGDGLDVHVLAERVTLDRARSLSLRNVVDKVRELVESRVSRLVSGAEVPPALCDAPGVVVHEIDRIGSPASIELLGELRPEVSVNTGGCGILRSDFLAAAGPILNVHCGLPYTRGFNAIEWTVWHRLPVRVCVHLLERGIDTGGVVVSREFPLLSGATADQLRVGYEEHYAPLVVEAIRKVLASGAAAATPQEAAVGKNFHAMHRSLRAALDARLAAGQSPARWTEDINAPDLARLSASSLDFDF